MTYIQYMRHQHHLTKKDMAEKLDMSITTYFRIEKSNDVGNFTFHQLSKIAMEFNITIDELIYKSENFNKESVQ
ncbi:helix-turn-helix domain-containing protein [Staphylococcus warneri]|uniref:helix-turn-helix domain-containing protein n=1 Tax=Staphylococcus warneri TaxID=1292 RepID=UPI0005E9CD91|nr:helix-turn-helix transcriptional regulator [Staphylococcus warneri]COE64429.1 Helix-turn-helix [Staphylococcus warneri]